MNFLTVFLSSGSLIDLDGTFFVQLIIFGLAYVVLRTFVFKPIMATLDAREEAIEGARRDARTYEQEALDKEAEFDQELRRVRLAAGDDREQLRAEAKELETTLLEKVRSETQSMLDEADEKLTAEYNRARKAIEDETPELARSIASQLLGRELR